MREGFSMGQAKQKQGFSLLWIFVCSGFAGLIYQSIWAQYLGLILGHSAYAQVLVLALFMGGMALGAWLISRRSELLKKPLMLYAAIELLIGLFGMVFHGYYKGISSWAYASFFPLLSSGLPLEVGRWGVAGLLIFPQCILLGATFPLMSAGYIRWRPEAGGRVLAGLYFSNSLGAAAGALASTYLLLPTVGLAGTVLTAGIINLMVAVLVWPLARLEQPRAVVLEERGEETEEKASSKFILWAAAVTGATSFVYEIVWVRMLSMVLGSTLHAFELMLAAFIAGIAFGGWWLRGRADKLRSSQKASGWAQMAKGFAAIGTLFVYNISFYWVAWLLQTLNRNTDSAYTLYNVASALIAMAVMFPAAFFAGMTLPLFTLTLLRKKLGERAIGRVYAVNTLGSIIGVVLTVYGLIPLLGLRLSLWGAAAADMVLGLLLLGLAWKGKPLGLRKRVLASLGCVLVLVLSVLSSRFDAVLMSSGVFRYGSIRTLGRELVYHKDGRTASVTVTQEGELLSIITNGKPDASIGMREENSADEMTMISAAVLPMLYRPEAQSVGIIGFGSGMSTHFVLGNPGIREVDTVEIEPAMVEGARHFGAKVARAYDDPRSHIIIDDAKSYFSTNRKKYDIIMSEPSNPWVSGVAALFSEEFYQFIPEHLSEGGLFVQWLQLYEITPPLVASVAKGLLPYFTDIHLFHGSDGDLIILASPRQKLPKVDGLAFPPSWPQAFREEMALRGLREDRDISSLFLGNKEVLEAFAGLFPLAPKNSDFAPILQLEAPKARFKSSETPFFADIKNADWPVLEVLTGLEAPPLDYRGAPDKLRSNYLAMRTKAKEARRWLLGGPQQEESRLAPFKFQEVLLLEHVKALGRDCGFHERERKGLHTLTQLARFSIPFLRPEDLEGLWGERAWLSCELQDATAKEYLDFIGALAKREYAAVLALGERLLRNEEILSDKSRVGYVLGGAELAALALGEYGRVGDLETPYAPQAPPDNARALMVQAARNRQKAVPPP
ncbi:MAG: fused MFS/spermidine synthase [Cystobacterineae bacterium]|nr:fused MFS/spermidine synthase [Cystobacterineae bacterium]